MIKMPLSSSIRVGRCQPAVVKPPCSGRLRISVLVFLLMLHLAQPRRCGAETKLDYKYEIYAEDRDRIMVRTHSALFDQSLSAWLSLRGNYVYDGISGATPTGGPPPAGSSQVPLARMDDVRQAGFIEPRFRIGRHILAPQVAYSSEEDYESLGLSLNYIGEFNEKNTTLTLGLAHNQDRLTGFFLRNKWKDKESTDVLLGVTQVLTPTTLVNLTLTFGTAAGYLSDPYKGFRFTGYPDPEALFPEKRPGHRTKQTALLSLNQHVEPLRGSAELSYRIYHDSHGLWGHTVTLEWLQKLGRYVVVAPLFRIYTQSAADFYRISFDADPSDSENPANAFIPPFYSADYRLSSLRTLTYGVSATVRLRDQFFLDLAYKRYEMLGEDGITAASNYPRAHVYTVGFRLHF